MCGWAEHCRRGLLAGLALAALVPSGTASALAGERLPRGIGQPLTQEEIARIDRDARFDGAGLPEGEGTVAEGEALYAAHCAACHGEFADGVGRIPALIGGEGTLASAQPVRTVGSFWPYAPGVFDYIHRAMPEGHAFSLRPKEVYALVAYLLNLNDIVEDDFIASASSLPKVRMPNRKGFVMPPHPVAQGRRCMRKCRARPVVTARAPARLEGSMTGDEEEPQP